MVIISSLLFLLVTAVSFFTIAASLISSMPHIIDIIQSRDTIHSVSPRINVGSVKYLKTSAKLANRPEHIVVFYPKYSHNIEIVENLINDNEAPHIAA